MDDAALLTLSQWLSPAYPLGGFAYSHGLETCWQDGRIGDAESLQTWLEDVLRHGSGWNDALFLSEAHRCNRAGLAALDARARAFVATRERLEETSRQGAAFCAATRRIWRIDLPDLVFPVALGFAAAQRGIPRDPAVLLYLQSFAGNLVSAATRAVPLGQTDAQGVLAALGPVCSEIAEATRDATLDDDLSSLCFAAEIAAMQHETLRMRVFRT